MKPYVGTHPVYVSHAAEVEQLLIFCAGLQDRLKSCGKDHGEQYGALVRVRKKCQDLLLKLYAEDSDVMLMDTLDKDGIVLIVSFVRDVLNKAPAKAG